MFLPPCAGRNPCYVAEGTGKMIGGMVADAFGNFPDF